MLIVQFPPCKSIGPNDVFVYGISDNQLELRWTYLGLMNDNGRGIRIYNGRKPDILYQRSNFPKLGELWGKAVTNEQSELLTGLHYPASMDRLIEIVADHYEPAFSPEGKSDVSIVDIKH